MVLEAPYAAVLYRPVFSGHNSSILGSFFANGQLNNKEKSRNGDTLGPVELFVWPEQGIQEDWHEQDDQGEGRHKKIDFFLGNSPKQRTPPTHRSSLGLT